MKKILLGLVLCTLSVFASAKALVSYTAISPDGTLIVHVYNAPCELSADIVAGVAEPYKHLLKKAEVNYQGKDLKACWVPLPEQNAIGVVDEIGDSGAVPMDAFQEDKEAKK